MSHTENFVSLHAQTLLFSAFGASLALHGVAYASLPARPPEVPAPITVSMVDFEVKVPPPEPNAPAPVPVPVPETPATSAVVPAPARAEAVKEPQAPVPTDPAAAAPLDLSGVTLTNDSSSGFAMPTGDGSALHGPIGSGGRGVGSAAPSVTRETRAAVAPKFVAARDLSEHPRPPALEGLLRGNYPEEARQRGRRGSASVRARIDADGVVRAALVTAESAAGFGAACQRTVRGSRWSAPRAQNGDAVATEIVYTCHFEVD